MKAFTAPGRLRSWVPTDLVLVTAYAAVAALALPETAPPLRVVVGLPLVLFVPGYVVLGVLFPRRAAADASGFAATVGSADRRGPTWVGRLALSVPTSLAVVALLALAAAPAAGGLTRGAVLTSLLAFTALGTVVGAWRRRRVPPGERFAVPWSRLLALRSAVASGSRIDTVVTVVLVVGIVAAASAMAYGVAAPERGSQDTEFALLSPDGSGDLVAGNFSTSIAPGESRELAASVTNREGESVEYTVVVEVQRVRTGGGDVVVVEQRELLRRSETVPAGERWQPRHEVEPSLTGEDLRLAYYLYQGDAPRDADADSAYRHLHLWIDVDDGANASAAMVGSGTGIGTGTGIAAAVAATADDE